MDEITRRPLHRIIILAVTGGNENGRYRLSAGYLSQDGIIKESGFKKILQALLPLSNSLKARGWVWISTYCSVIQLPIWLHIGNNSGFQGSLIGQALQWNPTHPLRKPNDSIWVNNQLGATTINPLAMLAAYSDKTNLNKIIASISPSYKILKNLEYRMLYSVNYASLKEDLISGTG